MKRPKDTFGFCRTGAAIHTAVDWRSRRAGLLGTKAVRRCFAGVFHNVCRVMRWWTERCTKRDFLAHTRTIPCPPTGTVHWARYAQLTDDPWILATVCVCVCVCVCVRRRRLWLGFGWVLSSSWVCICPPTRCR